MQFAATGQVRPTMLSLESMGFPPRRHERLTLGEKCGLGGYFWSANPFRKVLVSFKPITRQPFGIPPCSESTKASGKRAARSGLRPGGC